MNDQSRFVQSHPDGVLRVQRISLDIAIVVVPKWCIVISSPNHCSVHPARNQRTDTYDCRGNQVIEVLLLRSGPRPDDRLVPRDCRLDRLWRSDERRLRQRVDLCWGSRLNHIAPWRKIARSACRGVCNSARLRHRDCGWHSIFQRGVGVSGRVYS